MESITNVNLSNFFTKDWLFQIFLFRFLDMTWSILTLLSSQELLRKNYSIWISNELFQRLLFKIGNSYSLKIWLWVINPYIFWSKHEEKNYEHPGKTYSKSKEKKDSSKKNGTHGYA